MEWTVGQAHGTIVGYNARMFSFIQANNDGIDDVAASCPWMTVNRPRVLV